MTAQLDLVDLLRRWHDTTLAEGEALAQQNWDALAACQSRKSDWMRHWTIPLSNLDDAPPEARQLWEAILTLERRHYDQLTTGLQQTRQQLEALGHTRQNLRQLRRAYSAARPAAWESYS